MSPDAAAVVAGLREVLRCKRRCSFYSDRCIKCDEHVEAAIAHIESAAREPAGCEVLSNLPGEYEFGRIVREACDHDATKMRFYLTCSVGELAQRLARAALTNQPAAEQASETLMCSYCRRGIHGACSGCGCALCPKTPAAEQAMSERDIIATAAGKQAALAAFGASGVERAGYVMDSDDAYAKSLQEVRAESSQPAAEQAVAESFAATVRNRSLREWQPPAHEPARQGEARVPAEIDADVIENVVFQITNRRATTDGLRRALYELVAHLRPPRTEPAIQRDEHKEAELASLTTYQAQRIEQLQAEVERASEREATLRRRLQDLVGGDA